MGLFVLARESTVSFWKKENKTQNKTGMNALFVILLLLLK